MLNKFVHYLLTRVSQTLLKYNHSIESYLIKDSSANKPSSPEVLPGTPPAHWLEKVRQGAPHLLQKMDDENETDYLSTANSESETPSYFAQPRLRISNGRFYADSGSAETVTELAMRLFQHFALDKNRRVITSASETARSINKATPTNLWHKSSFQFPLINEKINSIFKSIKKNYARSIQAPVTALINKKKQHPASSSKPQKKETLHFLNSTIEKNSAFLFQDKNPVKAKPNQSAINNTSIKQAAKKNKATEENLHNKLSTNSSKQSLKTPKPNTFSKKETNRRNPTLHLYPKPSLSVDRKKNIPANKTNQKRTESIFTTTSHINKTTLSKVTQTQKTTEKVALTSPEHSKINFSIQPFNNTTTTDSLPLKKETKSAKTNSLMRDDTIPENFHPLPITNKDASIIQANPAINEDTETIQNHWPELPHQGKDKLSNTIDQPFYFWKIQQQAQSNLRRDQEQRGTLWNV